MKLEQLRTRLLSQFHHEPQKAAGVELGLAEVASGLAKLAQMGHLFHLEEGPAWDLAPWPKILFHVDSAPNGRQVPSAAAERDLGGVAEGWYPTLAEAQQASGVRAQFAGRGGIGNRNLPVAQELSIAEDFLARQARNQQTIDQWKRTRPDGPDGTKSGPE